MGLAALAFGNDSNALLRYTVDGVVVVKQIARTTFATITPVGNYVGSMVDITENCQTPANNGVVTTDTGPMRITLVGNFATIYAPTCYYEGTYQQQGSMGSLDGRYECTNKAQGAVTFTGLRFENSGLLGNYIGSNGSCGFKGNIGAARTLP